MNYLVLLLVVCFISAATGEGLRKAKLQQEQEEALQLLQKEDIDTTATQTDEILPTLSSRPKRDNMRKKCEGGNCKRGKNKRSRGIDKGVSRNLNEQEEGDAYYYDDIDDSTELSISTDNISGVLSSSADAAYYYYYDDYLGKMDSGNSKVNSDNVLSSNVGDQDAELYYYDDQESANAIGSTDEVLDDKPIMDILTANDTIALDTLARRERVIVRDISSAVGLPSYYYYYDDTNNVEIIDDYGYYYYYYDDIDDVDDYGYYYYYYYYGNNNNNHNNNNNVNVDDILDDIDIARENKPFLPQLSCPGSTSNAFPFVDIIPYGFQREAYGTKDVVGFGYSACNLLETCDRLSCTSVVTNGACNYDIIKTGACLDWKLVINTDGNIRSDVCSNSLDPTSSFCLIIPTSNNFVSGYALLSIWNHAYKIIPTTGITGLEGLVFKPNNIRLIDTIWIDTWIFLQANVPLTPPITVQTKNEKLALASPSATNAYILTIDSANARLEHQLNVHANQISNNFVFNCLDTNMHLTAMAGWSPIFHCTVNSQARSRIFYNSIYNNLQEAVKQNTGSTFFTGNNLNVNLAATLNLNTLRANAVKIDGSDSSVPIETLLIDRVEVINGHTRTRVIDKVASRINNSSVCDIDIDCKFVNVQFQAYNTGIDSGSIGRVDVWSIFLSAFSREAFFNLNVEQTRDPWDVDAYHTGISLIEYNGKYVVLIFDTGAYQLQCPNSCDISRLSTEITGDIIFQSFDFMNMIKLSDWPIVGL